MNSRQLQGPWHEARRLLRDQRAPLTAALLLVLANRLAALALPTASRYIVDEVIGRRRSDLLLPIALLAGLALLVESASAFGGTQLGGLAGHRAMAGLRRELHKRVTGLPLSSMDHLASGSLASRVVSDTEQVRFLVGNGSVQLAASGFTAAFALVLLFRLNVSLTVAVLSVLALLGVEFRCAFRHVSDAFEGVCRRQAELTGRFSQVLGGISVVKACVAERREAHRFAQEAHTLMRGSMQAVWGVARLSAGSTLAAGAVGIVGLVAGGRAVGRGTMSLGDLVMFVWLSGILSAPVMHIAASAGELGKAMAALRRIAGLRDLPTEAEEDRARSRALRVRGTVEFDDVSHCYAAGRLALSGLCMHADVGTTTALVGPSGSGKSTVCRLLLALDRPTTGQILIDGRDLATLRRGDYRAHVGAVLQDDVLFEGTIAANIRYGRPAAGWSEIRAAGTAAHCDEFVAALPEGYETVVGERGLRLSGGQRQRVAIARAILSNPRILVLDEATSSLDGVTEALVLEALRVLRRGRSTFIIAHRLSAIRSVDQIIVIDGGRVVERGTHEQLLARAGWYRQLFLRQGQEVGSLDWGSGRIDPTGGCPDAPGFRCAS